MDSWVPPWQGQTEGRNTAWMEGYGSGPWRDVSHGPPPPHSRRNKHYHEFLVGPQPWLDTQVEYHHPTYHPRLQNYNRPNSRAEYYLSSNPNWSYTRQGYEDLPRGFVEDYSYGAYQGAMQRQPSKRDPRWRDIWRESAHTRKQHYSRDYPSEEGTVSSGYHDAGVTQSRLMDSYEDTDASKKDTSYDIRHHSPLLQGQSWDEFQENILGNATVPVHEPSLLQQYKESGLSSSSYELSQYMESSSNYSEVAFSKDWIPIQSAENIQAISYHMTFQKFTLPHVPVQFGAKGQLVRGCPNDPAEGQPALVEIHSLEIILHDTAEQETMRVFPGPLTREDLHKVDVMTFCQLKAASGYDLTSNRERDSALLWKLLLLLCRQNGSTVGSDTAELLMQDRKYRERYKRQEPQVNLTDEEWPVQSCGIMTDLLTGEIVPSSATPEQRIEKFTKLLFYGRKKDALGWAMRNQLWGHALFLSSKMDMRTYSWVLNGFTSTLAFNDPLQTLFQLMSGRISQASLCCGDEKWGDWRPHLAVMLSNQIGGLGLNSKAIITMGDTLAGKGLIEAAHFCYLMANIPFGHYQVKTGCMVLLGSSQSQTFAQFARTECIQRTEILEYCRLLGCPQSFIPSFQVYKLIYASRLADYGLTAQALHYCEGVGMVLLAQKQNTYPVLLDQIIKLAERLKFSDPQLLEKADYDMAWEPDWLIELRAQYQQWKGERGLPNITFNMPEVKKNNGSISGLAPHFEFAETQVHRENLEQHPCSHRAPVNSSQHQLDVDEQLHIHPGHGHPSALNNVSLESGLLGNNQGAILSSRGLANDLSSHLNQASGGTVESSELNQFPGDQKQHIPEHLNAPNARTRTISESSTISMEEDTPRSPEGSWEEASSEKLAENARQEQAKASGFGWFHWFRSKTSKNVEPSKKVPAAPLDLTAPLSQEKTSQPPFFPPMDETKTTSFHCSPFPLPLTDGNHFHKSSLGAKNPQSYNMETAIFPDPGDQINSFNHQCFPDILPPPHTGGRLSLFSPAQVISPATSGIGYPQQSFQQ